MRLGTTGSRLGTWESTGDKKYPQSSGVRFRLLLGYISSLGSLRDRGRWGRGERSPHPNGEGLEGLLHKMLSKLEKKPLASVLVRLNSKGEPPARSARA